MPKSAAKKTAVVASTEKKERAKRLPGMTASPHGKPIKIWIGLSSFEVRLYSSAVSQSVSFPKLHGACGTKLSQQLVCPHDHKVVEHSAAVKGYEHQKGAYLQFTDKEIQRFEVGEDDRLDIEEFVPVDSVDIVYVEKSHYLGPGKGSDRGYALLAELLAKSGRGGIGRWGAKGKLVFVRPYRADGLLLQQLFYASEVRSFDDVDRGSEIAIHPKAVAAAAEQIAKLSSERFDPSKYRDEYQDRVLFGIAEKAAGRELAPRPQRVEPSKVLDLGEFRESVDAGVAKINAVFDRGTESIADEG